MIEIISSNNFKSSIMLPTRKSSTESPIGDVVVIAARSSTCKPWLGGRLPEGRVEFGTRRWRSDLDRARVLFSVTQKQVRFGKTTLSEIYRSFAFLVLPLLLEFNNLWWVCGMSQEIVLRCAQRNAREVAFAFRYTGGRGRYFFVVPPWLAACNRCFCF